jgi:hypothetical protein
MLTGKRFRLNTAILGIETIEGQRRAVQVPSGDIVAVVSGPAPDDRRMLDVLWNDRPLVMFAEDLTARGHEIGQRSGASA